MKIAIEELLAAMDMAAAKALGQQQYNLNYAGLNLNVKNQKEGVLLAISGNTLIIEPQILSSGNALVNMKIAVRQKSKTGKSSELLATQFTFVRMPANKFASEGQLAQPYLFTSYSAN